MTSSHIIAINIMATYLRSLVTVGLALFSSRWVLNALGQEDFGLFYLVGSLIVFVTFLNSVFSGSSARHFSFSLGRGEPLEVNKWFNAALSVHLVIATILLFVGWAIGEYCILNYFTIPDVRMHSCIVVFRVSLVSSFVSMVSIPYIAMFKAKQKFVELAVWDLAKSLVLFCFAGSLYIYHGDRLIYYGLGFVVVYVLFQLVQVARSIVVFSECRLEKSAWFEISRIKEIVSFAGWSLIGISGGVLRAQGSSILLNIYFGPVANASYGIANQVSTQANNLSTSMLGAFLPEITASEGRGDRKRMLELSVFATKIGTLLVMFFAVPLIVEMDYILKLWLKTPPVHAVELCRLLLVTFIIDRLSAGYLSAVYAHGKIAGYQATIGVVLFLTLPLAWLFLHLGYSPVSVGVAFVATQIIGTTGRVYWVKRLFGIGYSHWFRHIIVPCSIVCIASSVTASFFVWMMDPSFARMSIVLIVSFIAAVIATWFAALERSEKETLVGMTKVFRAKITKK